jgi:hypothetical protein
VPDVQNDPALHRDLAGEPDPELAALVQPATGVATGSLGTGTAIDDTQVYDADELRIAASEAPIAEVAPPAELEDPVPIGPAQVAPIAAPPSPQSSAADRVAVPRPARATHTTGTPRLAGIAAGALILLIIGAAAVTSLANNRGAFGQAPGQSTEATSPATDVPAADDGGGAGGGGGGGGGNGGGGNGGGNGRGNGGGGGNGNGNDKPH